MKQLTVLTVIIALMTNLESTTETVLNPTITPVQIVTSNVQVHAKKPKLKSSLKIQPLINSKEETLVDDDVVLARNRNRLGIVHEKESELSDYVKIRLMLARMKALDAYKKTHAQVPSAVLAPIAPNGVNIT
jgi:hypothetical protein